jgi:S-(hydroxymethyl)glutathione dehydrogenase/alcohol dehydrogenase
MQLKAAVLWGLKEQWSVENVELDPPRENEVLVKLAASGLCHSDEHLRTGDIPIPFPVIGGHEGAGVVEAVGPGVSTVAVGDHVVLSFIPACGTCRYCTEGHSNLCDLGAGLLLGPQLDGTYRFHARGQDTGQMCLLGTFSPYTVVPVTSVVKIDDDLPLQVAALVGCGVTTGIGSATHRGEVQPGSTVVVMGAGGIGMNAIQGARLAGALHIVAVDPVAAKREWATQFGATHATATVDEAWQLLSDLTRGQMADVAILTTDVAEGAYLGQALSLVGKRGRVVVTAIGHPEETTAAISLFETTLYEKEVRGALFGSSNPRVEIPKILAEYRHGRVRLNELVTRTYQLEEINQGYDDLLAGRNLRGMIVYE